MLMKRNEELRREMHINKCETQNLESFKYLGNIINSDGRVDGVEKVTLASYQICNIKVGRGKLSLRPKYTYTIH